VAVSNPLLGSLVDAFTEPTLNTAIWNSSTPGSVGIAAPGRAYVQVAPGFPHLGAIGASGYSAAGQAVYARVTPAPAGAGSAQVTTFFQITADSGDLVQFICTPGTAYQAQVLNAGVATTVALPTYDPTQHAWWRLRETGGSWAFDVSADGSSWATLTTLAYSWSPASVGVYVLAHTSDGTTGGSAYVEHVNTPTGAGTLMPSWPQIRFGVAFNAGGSQATQPAYVDLSSRLRGSWSAELAGRQYELDQIQSGQLTVSLWNLDGALDPINTASPYAPNVVPMRSCRLQAVWPPSRNLMPQNVSSGTSTAGLGASAGSVAPASGLPAAPTGHATAHAWSVPAAAAAASVMGLIALGSPGWPVADASAVPVVAGQQYTFSCWVAQGAGGDATLQAAHRVSWYPVSGSRITVGIGSAVTVPVLGTSWALVTYTVTAPAGAVSCRPGVQISSSPAVASTVYVTAWQVEQAATASPWTPGGVVYPLWAGFVERWPQRWSQQGTYGTVDLTCVDVLAGLSQFTLQPNLQAQLASLRPSFMYPFNEPTGSSSFADATGQWRPRAVANSVRGQGSASITAGNSVQGSGSVGSAGPVVTLVNPSYGQNNPAQGQFIDSPALQAPPTSGGWTRIIAYRTTTVPPTGSAMCLWAASGPGAFTAGTGSRALVGIYLDSSQHLYGAISDPTGTYTATVPVPDVLSCDGNWHMAIIQLSSDGTTFTVANDEHGYVATTTGAYTPSGCTADTIGAVANRPVGATNYLYQGDLAFAAQVPYPIGNSAAYDLGSGFSTGWAGETSAARAQRILMMCGYGGTITTQDASMAMGGANLAGVDPMTALETVADTEAGQVVVDGAGTLWLTGRLWRYLQSTATVTFGENQASGEVPYLGDVTVELDPTHVYNVAQVTNQAAPGAATQPAQTVNNPASQAAYLPRTLQRTINAQDPTMALQAGQYLVSQYGQPQPRLSALTVDGASNPALWSTILGLGFGTRAQVNRRPPSWPGAPEISVQQFVEHVAWEGDDQGNLKVRLQLTPAGPYLGWWVAAPLHTTMAVASTAGTTTVTLAALTGSASNPASSVLTPGTVLTLGYGTAAAEQLTVQSVAATTAGYSSVAVTFTSGTAHNHAVGDVVCQPLPSGYQLPTTTATGFPASLDSGATLSATGPRAAY
jgi:hypothetical protein